MIFNSFSKGRENEISFFFSLCNNYVRNTKKIFLLLAGDGGGAGGDGDSMVGGGNSEKKNTEYETNLFLYSVSKYIFHFHPLALRSIDNATLL